MADAALRLHRVKIVVPLRGFSSTGGVEEDEEFEEKGLFFRKCSIFAEIYRALCSCSWFGIW